MGFDLGALLRGGGAGMAGYTEGKAERQKREEEARRAALSEALMNAQFKTQTASQANYESLAEQRRQQALIDQQRADAYERNLNDQIRNRGVPTEPKPPTPSESRAAHGDRLRLVRTRATEMTRPETNVYSGATDDQESMTAFVRQLQQEFPDMSRSELAAELYGAKDDYSQEQRSAASAERADSRPQSVGGLSLSPALQAEFGIVSGGATTPPTAAPPSAAGAWLGGDGQGQSAKAQLEAAVRAAGRSPEETARALERIAGMSEQDAAARIGR